MLWKDWPRFLKNARRNSDEQMAVKKPQTGATPQASTVSDASLRGLCGYTLKRTFNAIQANLALTLRPYD
jgi:hypothetical protein